MSRIILISLVAAAVVVLAGCGGYSQNTVQTEVKAPVVMAPTVEKIKIDSLDDLPVHTYPLQGTPSEMLASHKIMAELQSAVLADIESDLNIYLIEDVKTLQGMHQNLATLAFARHDLEEALKQLNIVSSMEDKEATRLMGGIVSRAYIAAKGQALGAAGESEFLNVFGQELQVYLFALPYDVVQDQVKSGKARSEYLSENLLLGMVQSQFEPAAEAMGELNSQLAMGLIGIRYAMDERLFLNPMVAEIYGEYLAANKVEKNNIWPARDLILSADQNLAPVMVGIWDSGVDVAVFGDAIFVNGAEKQDGTDTDGNGFVDDVHGIGYDVSGYYTTDLLHPLGDQDGKLDAVFEYMQGFVDMTSAIDSPSATAVRGKMANIAPEEVGDFLTTLSFGGLFMHGTHVAGITVKDNPFAKVLVARISFDYHMTPAAMTVEIAERLAADYSATTQYFRTHDVRVVNMSWGWSFKEIEGSLEANGVGENAEERAKMAREMIDILSKGLHQSMADAPEILFVSAAGNSDNDVEFDVVIPSSFDLPNLIIVGALDQAGDPTSFTSGGRNVKVYANGFQVESTVPGGGTMKMSGTSMASPNVANTAAKLIALDPSLTPVQVIKLIEDGTDPHPDHAKIWRMNAKKSAELQ